MGQYFIVINEDKKEYVDPHGLGDGVKFLELISGDTPRALAYLLRRSSGSGGGDVPGSARGPLCGHWAGDRISIVGDYDESKLYGEAENSWRNITEQLDAELSAAREIRRF